MHKWLTDENVPRQIIKLLRAQRYDVKDIREEGMAGAKDTVVMALATREERILVTTDKDFSSLILYPPGTHGGIVVLKMRHPTGRGLTNLFRRFLDTYDLSKIPSALVMISEGKVRIRK